MIKTVTVELWSISALRLLKDLELANIIRVIDRDKKKEKTLLEIKSITRKDLLDYQIKLSRIKKELNSLNSLINSHKSVKQLKELRYQLDHYTLKKERLLNELNVVNLESGEDVDAIKTSIVNNVKELINVELEIKLN